MPKLVVIFLCSRWLGRALTRSSRRLPPVFTAHRICSRLGITQLRLVLTVAGVLSAFAIIIAFVFVVVQTFGEQDSFTAVVSSIFLGVATIYTSVTRTITVQQSLNNNEIHGTVMQELASGLARKNRGTAVDVFHGMGDASNVIGDIQATVVH